MTAVEQWVEKHRRENFRFVPYIDVRVSRTGRKHAPFGYSSSQVAEMVGVPARTVHSWRQTGFFEPSVGAELGLVESIYCLGDVFAVMAARRLLEAGVQRDACHWTVSALPRFNVPKGAHMWADYRHLAELDVWVLVPSSMRLVAEAEQDHPDEPLLIVPEGQLLEHFELDPEEGFAMWVGPETDPLADDEDVWLPYPLSRFAAVLVERADAWRDQTARVPAERCAPWM